MIRLKRLIVAMALTLASAIGVLLASAPTASAACPNLSGYTGLCAYEHSNYGGNAIGWDPGQNEYTFTDTHWYHSLFYPTINDQVSSVWNQTGWGACFFTNWHYSGSVDCIPPWTAYSFVGWDWNDRFSSLRQD